MDIPIKNQFIPIEFDLSSTEVREIGKLGFIVNENLTDEAVVQIDKIDFLLSRFKTYNLEYKKATYTLKANRQSVKAEFGEPQMRLENYIKTLLTSAQELRYLGGQSRKYGRKKQGKKSGRESPHHIHNFRTISS